MTKICTQTCDKATSLNSYRGMDNVFYTDSDLKPWCRCMWRYWLSSVWTDRLSFQKSVDETFCKRKDHPHAVSVCKSREEVCGQRDAPPAAPQLILFKRPASEVQRKQHVHCEVIRFSSSHFIAVYSYLGRLQQDWTVRSTWWVYMYSVVLTGLVFVIFCCSTDRQT